MELNELIDSIESLYSKEQQKEILELFWKAEKESHIPDSPLLFDLIDKSFLKISDKKHIEYRLEKYFDKNNITSVSAKKKFIFNHLPNLKGLARGRNTSYDDTIDFISTNYYDLFDEILNDFKTYSFGDIIGKNGHNLALYLYRTVGNGSCYKFNYKTDEYELKDDEVIHIMQERGYKFEKPTGGPQVLAVKIDMSDAIRRCKNTYYKELIKQFFVTLFKTLIAFYKAIFKALFRIK